MLTLFAIPKPFTGHIDVIQRNAIASWTKLAPACEVILCGDDLGVKEYVEEIGVRHIADIEKNEFGTPLLNSAFQSVIKSANNKMVCYVNSDIILLQSFVDSIQRITFPKFLMIGQCVNLEMTELIDYAESNWSERIMDAVKVKGCIRPRTAIDYFVFNRDGGYDVLPPFAVGRPGWDNWFLYLNRSLKIPVVDATLTATVIHQKHDYAHVKAQRGGAWEGPEADQNRSLIGASEYLFTITEATHKLTAGGIKRAYHKKNLVSRIKVYCALHPKIGRIARWTNDMMKRIGIYTVPK